MSSSSPSSSSSPPRSRKRSAKAMELDSTSPPHEGWLPKIRIINFDPSRKPGDKSVKRVVTDNDVESTPIQAPEIEESTTEQPHRSNHLPLLAPTPEPSSSTPIVTERPFVPQVLMFNDIPIFPSDPLYPLLTCAKFCENCRTSETSYWRTDDTGKDHCNPCGLHWTKHHSPRPIDPNHEPTVGKLINLACQICPTRKHARRREEYRGIILCNACTDYWKRNNAVRPLIAFAKRPKGDRAKEAGMIRQTKKCANCGTGRSSRWMIGPDGEDNCSECGLFWMYHNMRRPLGVGVGVDVIGPKRETRGPKIMESRKRRLGSVNTGSGSDSENEDNPMDEVTKMEDVSYRTRKNGEKAKEIEPAEPPDDSPVSLVNLAILARKVQLHFQELSLLNSPLLRRPAITSLLSAIDPVITELSPLSTKNLSAFTRSTLSKGVIQNLLAHVMAAEAESATSETERLRVVLDDSNFGPNDVGDNFYTGNIQKEAIVAAKGLIDLCKDSTAMEDDEVEEDDISPDLTENQDQDMMLQEHSESTVSSQQLQTDRPSNVTGVPFLENESQSTFEVPGDTSDRAKEDMTSIHEDYNFVASLDDELPTFGFSQHLEEFGNVGN